jgi:hypothetical protein
VFAGVRQSSALRTLKSMIGKAKEWKVLRERTSFTIPEAPGRDVLIDDAAETAIERELGKANALEGALQGFRRIVTCQCFRVFLILKCV